jgi:hypothetical protein
MAILGCNEACVTLQQAVLSQGIDGCGANLFGPLGNRPAQRLDLFKNVIPRILPEPYC